MQCTDNRSTLQPLVQAQPFHETVQLLVIKFRNRRGIRELKCTQTRDRPRERAAGERAVR